MIEWEDSHACGTWQEIDGDIEDMALVCRSVGWLVLDGEHAKVVAPHLSQEGAGVPLQGNGIMTIPARAILQLVPLTSSCLPSSACSEIESGRMQPKFLSDSALPCPS